MKANEAPERIWIDPATDLSKLSGHIDNDSVEYTRTDAFIERACEWMKQNVVGYLSDTGVGIVFDEWNGIEEFKKAMKL